MPHTLRQIIERTSPDREPIITVVAGSGQIAHCAVEAGADLLMALNAGLYRSLGTGSLAAFLPYGNANEQTERLLREEILPRTKQTPVVAGVFAADETQPLDAYLKRLQALGVQGVVNWPAIGFIDGRYRELLNAEGLGTAREASMLRQAKGLGLTTFGFALDKEQVACFVKAGVDGLILNLGLTHQVDQAREKRDQLQQAIVQLNGMVEVAQQRPAPPLCLAFGGPITTAEDLEQLFRHSMVHGFAGGSVFERLPVQSAVVSTIRRFKSTVLSAGHEARESGLGAIIGCSPAMLAVFDLIRRVAPQDVNVCIEGETGTGKELIAMQIHRMSRRAGQPFITLNCGAIPDTLLESELFGHEKGAFTGADRRRLGKFELAQGGTLFLDEIADLSPRGQVALLRAIQQREITRIGGDVSIPVDVRILAASNRPLWRAVRRKRFREDLYYRLNYILIQAPPLRERADDLPLLTHEILSRLEAQINRKISGISAVFSERLRQHAWPGNIRELEHVLGQAAIREDGEILEGNYFQPASLSHSRAATSGCATPLPDPATRGAAAREALRKSRGNKALAARALGITRKTLYAWLRETP